MARKLDDVMAALPKARRERIEARTMELATLKENAYAVRPRPLLPRFCAAVPRFCCCVGGFAQRGHRGALPHETVVTVARL